jgi:hypothetical protein
MAQVAMCISSIHTCRAIMHLRALDLMRLGLASGVKAIYK